jgi:thiol-disulfide isomerase/thioredoxin
LIVLLLSSLTAFAQKPEADKPSANAAQASEPAKDSDDDLRRAIEGSGGSETQMMVNLEGYLKKYPASTRRDEIENEIYKMSVRLRDRNRTISYAERLVTKDENNIDALTNLVTTLRERRGEGDLNRALTYADLLVKRFDDVISNSVKPRRISAAQWEDRKDQGVASVYLLRGRVHADLNNNDKAREDLTKSFDSAPLAGAALLLGELAERRKNIDEAIDFYLKSFAIALNTDEEIDLKSLRRKLGQIYSSKHGTETGLGDRLLKAHDAFVKEREERLAKLEKKNVNAGLTDPLDFTLTKLDGSPLKMSDHRGKVIVINFWATWCGPCLTELPLFEKTIAKYKDDPNVVFLAITTDEDRELVAPFLKQHKFNLPVAYAEYLDAHFGITSIPTTIILDQKGELSFRQAGYNPREDFVAMLTEKIEAAKKR